MTIKEKNTFFLLRTYPKLLKKQPRSKFIKTAQEYKPDILIPELKTAIEYKYAKSENRLKAIIDQIYADAANYTNDDDYLKFYAVFIIDGNFWAPPKCEAVWKEKNFPPNWIGIFQEQ